jgi:glycosyltransferase involved in cell wall biosynthesis
MFRVGLDTSALDGGFKNHAMRGIGRYVQELNRYFLSQHSSDVSVGTFDQGILRQKSLASSFIDSLPAGKRTLSQQLLYPLRLRKGPLSAFDVVHFPAHMDAPAWSPKKYILTVLDLIPLVLKDLYKADKPSWRFAFARFLEIRAIKSASLIVAISHNTARDVHEILGVPEEKIVVTHLGVDRKFFDARLLDGRDALCARYKLSPNRPFVLYVGGIDQRKNFSGLLKAFKELLIICKERQKPLPQLIMAGNIQTDGQYPKLLELARTLSLESDIAMPGFVEDRDLLQLYSISSVFFFPSLYEGFGLPPLEAMAAGTPVVSSGTSSMPEVLGEAALLVDPLNAAESAKALFEVLHTQEIALSLRQLGRKQAEKFTWQATGEQTLKAYERLALQNG